jgi:hypothetical protein
MMSKFISSLLVSFGGHSLRVSFDASQIANAFQSHLRHCRVDEGTSPSTELRVSTTGTTFRIFAEDRILFSNLNFDLALQALMTETISRLVSVCERGLVLHAAALAQDENAILLSGQGGSGKSTLAAWLTADGLQYLTDEVLEISLDGKLIQTFPRSIFLKHGSAFVWQNRLRSTKSTYFLRFADNAAWIDPHLFNPIPPAYHAAPRLLIFPHYIPDAQLQFKKLTTGEALFFILQNVTNARNLPLHGMDAATNLARQVTAYTLTYSDIESASAWIHKTLQAG